MKRGFLLVPVVLVLLLYSNAYAGAGFGPELDWNHFQNGGSGDWGIGARLDAGGVVRFIGSFDYYFVNADILGDNSVFTGTGDTNLRFYEINTNLAVLFPTESIHPYVGGGLSISKRTFDNVTLSNFFDDNKTELGLNLLGGLKFGDSAIQPFVEARGVFYHGDETFNNRFVVTGGILF